MAVLQQYRTSFHDINRNLSGFGTKAASAGITPEMESQLLLVNSYKMPRGLDERELASHPIALRYLYLNPSQSILLCAQSCEPDVTGRPGNYFSHSLILPPSEFINSNTSPVFYWRSSFWKTADPSDQSVLPTLPTFDAKVSFDAEQVSPFLQQGTRASQFYKLLAAVIHSSKSTRRIILIDSADHVALWVAALSLALPSYYRPLLSFATYHEAPLQAPFTVIGTAPSMFIPSLGANASYFILNTEDGSVGPVAESKYARRVTDLLVQDLFHDDLLTLFSKATSRFPRPTQINEQLDQVAEYLEVLEPHHQVPLTPSQLESVHQPRQTFDALPTYEDEDREELHHLTDTLGDQIRVQPIPAVVSEYVETLRVLARRDTHAIERVPNDLLLAANLLMESNQTKLQAGIDLVTTLRQDIFKDKPKEFSQKINSPAYLRQLTGLVQKATIAQLAAIWRYIGRYLEAGTQSQDILIASLRAASGSSKGAITEEEEQFFAVMRVAMRGGPERATRETDWLRVALACRKDLPGHVLGDYYYLAILGGLPGDGGLALDERVANRRVIQTLEPNIIEVEIENDLAQAVSKSNAKDVLSLLENWTNHLRRQQLDASRQLQFALAKLAEMSPKQTRELAGRMLLSPPLKQALSDESKRWLLKIVLEGLRFHQVKDEQVQICREYQALASQLSENIAILVMGVLAMSDHTLDRKKAMQLRSQFSKMDPQTYQLEIEKVAAEFFDPQVTGDSHGQMVAAVYRWEYRDVFWQTYWLKFKDMILNSQADLTVRLLGFWFDRSLSDLNDQQFVYVIQGFFLGLPNVVSDMHNAKGFSQAAEQISRLASRKEWYPLVQNIFTVERRGILGPISGIGDRLGGIFGRKE